MTSLGMLKEFNLTTLSNILSTDTCELKQSMETKLNEFQNIISGKLNNLYYKSIEGHDKILFDTDGKDIIRQCNSYAKVELCNNGAFKKDFQWYPLSFENNKCFTLSCHNKYDNYINDHIFIFNTFIIYIEGRKDGVFTRPQILNHNLSIECLFSIKYFQANIIRSGIGLYRSKPEYFNKNYSYFEEICKKEYENQLQAVIDTNLSKQEYYISLENKIKELKIKNQELESELVKLKDGEKKNIEIEKQKIE